MCCSNLFADERTNDNFTCICAPNYAGTKCELAYCEVEHCQKGLCNETLAVSTLLLSKSNHKSN